jgi:hypothetical protein
MRADIHDGQEHKRSIHGPDTEAQDQSSPSVTFGLQHTAGPYRLGHKRPSLRSASASGCPLYLQQRPNSEMSRRATRRHRNGYSITLSAVARSPDGIVSASALAVLRLITNSYLAGSWIGSSPGLAPLRMRSMYPAAPLKDSSKASP